MNISNELYEKTKSDFIKNVISQGTYASEYDLRQVLDEFDNIIGMLKDKDEKEMVDIVIEDSVRELLQVLSSDIYVPGFVFGVKVNDIDTKVYGGYRDSNNSKIEADTMFDIASITKMFTQIMIYSLVNEGVLSLDDEVSKLDPRFKFIYGVTIRDITSFSVEFKTFGRIDEAKDLDEARKSLFSCTINNKDSFNYNDIGMMILKEVMESKTNLSYKELLDKYIVSKLGLESTKLDIDDILKNKLTGSPNMNKGRVNDLKANLLGGYSGHAGIWSNSDDLIRVGEALSNGDFIPDELLRDFYSSNRYDSDVAAVGNSFIPSVTCLDFVDKLNTRRTFSFQGSTRTELTTQKFDEYVASSTILFNTAIMDQQEAIIWEDKINNERIRCNLKPITVYKSNGCYVQNDIRRVVPIKTAMVPLNKTNAKTSLKLMFLDTLLRNYEKGIDLNVKVETDITSRIK